MNTNISNTHESNPTATHDEPTNMRPRSQWDEDEIFDGRPKPATIEILVVSPSAAPYLHTLDQQLGRHASPHRRHRHLL